MSSKKDQLGRGASFGSAASARSARRAAIDQTINGSSAEDTAAITDLPVALISDNPDNPRNHLRNLEATVESVREVGIILPIVVGTIDAYLRDRADRADDLDDGAQYVVADGHRRLEAARRVGLATIPVRVDNAHFSTDETLLEAAFIANFHREDMTDLEEAHALAQLVKYYGGSQTKACKRLSISSSTLSSKLSLLKLSPELQKDLMTGSRTTEHVRNLGKLPPAAQKAKADERAEAARRKAEARRQKPPERSAVPEDFHGVKSNGTITAEPEQHTAAPPPRTVVPESVEPQPHADTVPEPRTEPQASEPDPEAPFEPTPPKLPYDDGSFLAMHLIRKMPKEEFDKMLDILIDHRAKQAANAD